MTISETPLEIYDIEEGKKLAANNEQLAKDLFGMLIKELPEHKNKLEEARKNNDIKKLKSQIHKLNGATSYCGVPQLRSSANKLEKFIDCSETDYIENAYHEVQAAIVKLIEYSKTNP